MNSDYLPILVERDGKKELWRMDISRLSVTELIKLKEDLLKMPYDKTIRAIDAIIKREIEVITPSNCLSNDSYMRSYKKNKKNAKIEKNAKMKKAKIRRR